MYVNTKKLKGCIVEKGTTQEAVADSIGIDRSTFYRKVKNQGVSFSIGEVHKLVKVIPLTKEEAIEIILAQ
jgi:predicted transcriptional regulator